MILSIRILSVFTLLIGMAIGNSQPNGIAFYPEVQKSDVLPKQAQDRLTTNIQKILGSSGATDAKRFTLYGKPIVIEESVTPTTPPMYKVALEVQLIAADVLEKRIYGNYTFANLIGLSRNRNNAFIQALNKVKGSKRTKKFLKKVSTKISNYYQNNCTAIITQASTLSARGSYDKAILKLEAIPNINEDCFYTAQSKIHEISTLKTSKTDALSDIPEKAQPKIYEIVDMISSPETKPKTDSILKTPTEDGLDSKEKEHEDYDWITSDLEQTK